MTPLAICVCLFAMQLAYTVNDMLYRFILLTLAGWLVVLLVVRWRLR